MKRMKKIISMVLVVAVIVAMGIGVFADPDRYGKVTISSYGQTAVFDKAYIDKDITMTDSEGGTATLTPVIIAPDSNITVTSSDNLLHVMVYIETNNSGIIESSGLGGCQAKTGSVNQIFDYDWTYTGSERNNEKAYFLIAKDGEVGNYYWLQMGDADNSTGTSTGSNNTGSNSTGTTGNSDSANNDSASTGNTTYTHSYSDVQPGAWYYDAVMTMTDNGVLAGYGNGNFGPNDIITDAQLATIMNRLVKRIDSNASVDWSASKRITRGEAAIYIVGVLQSGSSSSILSETRLALAQETGMPYYTDPMMYNGQPYMNARLEGVWFRLFYTEGRRVSEVRHSAADFPDSEAILACADKWATENEDRFLASHEEVANMAVTRICTAWNLGMFAGYDDIGTFGANNSITRAQLCQALYNMGFDSENCILN